MNTRFTPYIPLFLSVGCGGGLFSEMSPKSFSDDVCSSLFACMADDERFAHTDFETAAECRKSVKNRIDDNKWNAHISMLESTFLETCSNALTAHPENECQGTPMEMDTWLDSINIDECAAVYLYPVIGNWTGSCTHPTTGERREFILIIEESSGHLLGQSQMQIQPQTGEGSNVLCDVDFDYTPSEILAAQLISSTSNPNVEAFTTAFTCDNGEYFSLPLFIDEQGLLSYCDMNNDIELRFGSND